MKFRNFIRIFSICMTAVVIFCGVSVGIAYLAGAFNTEIIEPTSIKIELCEKDSEDNWVAIPTERSNYNITGVLVNDKYVVYARVTTETLNVSENNVQLSISGTTTSSEGFITDGKIRIPANVKLGNVFEIELVQKFDTEINQDWLVGGISSISARSEALTVRPSSLTVNVDVPIHSIKQIDLFSDSQMNNKADNNVFASQTTLYANAVLLPARSAFRYGNVNDKKQVFYSSLPTQSDFIYQSGTGAGEEFSFSTSNAFNLLATTTSSTNLMLQAHVFSSAQEEDNLKNSVEYSLLGNDVQKYYYLMQKASANSQEGADSQTAVGKTVEDISIAKLGITQFNLSLSGSNNLYLSRPYTIFASRDSAQLNDNELSLNMSFSSTNDTILYDQVKYVGLRIFNSNTGVAAVKDTDYKMLRYGAFIVVKDRDYYKPVLSVADYKNSFWQVSFLVSGNYKIEIEYIYDKDECNFSGESSTVVKNLNFSVAEINSSSVYFSNTSNVDLVFVVNNDEVNNDEVNNDEHVEYDFSKYGSETNIFIPEANTYKTVKFFAMIDSTASDVISAVRNNTNLVIGGKLPAGIALSEHTSFEIPNGILRVKGKMACVLKVFFITVKTDAQGAVLYSADGEYQLDKFSSLNAETLQYITVNISHTINFWKTSAKLSADLNNVVGYVGQEKTTLSSLGGGTYSVNDGKLAFTATEGESEVSFDNLFLIYSSETAPTLTFTVDADDATLYNGAVAGDDKRFWISVVGANQNIVNIVYGTLETSTATITVTFELDNLIGDFQQFNFYWNYKINENRTYSEKIDCFYLELEGLDDLGPVPLTYLELYKPVAVDYKLNILETELDLKSDNGITVTRNYNEDDGNMTTTYEISDETSSDNIKKVLFVENNPSDYTTKLCVNCYDRHGIALENSSYYLLVAEGGASSLSINADKELSFIGAGTAVVQLFDANREYVEGQYLTFTIVQDVEIKSVKRLTEKIESNKSTIIAASDTDAEVVYSETDNGEAYKAEVIEISVHGYKGLEISFSKLLEVKVGGTNATEDKVLGLTYDEIEGDDVIAISAVTTEGVITDYKLTIAENLATRQNIPLIARSGDISFDINLILLPNIKVTVNVNTSGHEGASQGSMSNAYAVFGGKNITLSLSAEQIITSYSADSTLVDQTQIYYSFAEKNADSRTYYKISSDTLTISASAVSGSIKEYELIICAGVVDVNNVRILYTAPAYYRTIDFAVNPNMLISEVDNKIYFEADGSLASISSAADIIDIKTVDGGTVAGANPKIFGEIIVKGNTTSFVKVGDGESSFETAIKLESSSSINKPTVLNLVFVANDSWMLHAMSTVSIAKTITILGTTYTYFPITFCPNVQFSTSKAFDTVTYNNEEYLLFYQKQYNNKEIIDSFVSGSSWTYCHNEYSQAYAKQDGTGLLVYNNFAGIKGLDGSQTLKVTTTPNDADPDAKLEREYKILLVPFYPFYSDAIDLPFEDIKLLLDMIKWKENDKYYEVSDDELIIQEGSECEGGTGGSEPTEGEGEGEGGTGGSEPTEGEGEGEGEGGTGGSGPTEGEGEGEGGTGGSEPTEGEGEGGTGGSGPTEGEESEPEEDSPQKIFGSKILTTNSDYFISYSIVNEDGTSNRYAEIIQTGNNYKLQKTTLSADTFVYLIATITPKSNLADSLEIPIRLCLKKNASFKAYYPYGDTRDGGNREGALGDNIVSAYTSGDDAVEYIAWNDNSASVNLKLPLTNAANQSQNNYRFEIIKKSDSSLLTAYTPDTFTYSLEKVSYKQGGGNFVVVANNISAYATLQNGVLTLLKSARANISQIEAIVKVTTDNGAMSCYYRVVATAITQNFILYYGETDTVEVNHSETLNQQSGFSFVATAAAASNTLTFSTGGSSPVVLKLSDFKMYEFIEGGSAMGGFENPSELALSFAIVNGNDRIKVALDGEANVIKQTAEIVSNISAKLAIYTQFGHAWFVPIQVNSIYTIEWTGDDNISANKVSAFDLKDAVIKKGADVTTKTLKNITVEDIDGWTQVEDLDKILLTKVQDGITQEILFNKSGIIDCSPLLSEVVVKVFYEFDVGVDNDYYKGNVDLTFKPDMTCQNIVSTSHFNVAINSSGISKADISSTIAGVGSTGNYNIEYTISTGENTLLKFNEDEVVPCWTTTGGTAVVTVVFTSKCALFNSSSSDRNMALTYTYSIPVDKSVDLTINYPSFTDENNTVQNLSAEYVYVPADGSISFSLNDNNIFGEQRAVVQPVGGGLVAIEESVVTLTGTGDRTLRIAISGDLIGEYYVKLFSSPDSVAKIFVTNDGVAQNSEVTPMSIDVNYKTALEENEDNYDRNFFTGVSVDNTFPYIYITYAGYRIKDQTLLNGILDITPLEEESRGYFEVSLVNQTSDVAEAFNKDIFVSYSFKEGLLANLKSTVEMQAGDILKLKEDVLKTAIPSNYAVYYGFAEETSNFEPYKKTNKNYTESSGLILQSILNYFLHGGTAPSATGIEQALSNSKGESYLITVGPNEEYSDYTLIAQGAPNSGVTVCIPITVSCSGIWRTEIMYVHIIPNYDITLVNHNNTVNTQGNPFTVDSDTDFSGGITSISVILAHPLVTMNDFITVIRTNELGSQNLTTTSFTATLSSENASAFNLIFPTLADPNLKIKFNALDFGQASAVIEFVDNYDYVFYYYLKIIGRNNPSITTNNAYSNIIYEDSEIEIGPVAGQSEDLRTFAVLEQAGAELEKVEIVLPSEAITLSGNRLGLLSTLDDDIPNWSVGETERSFTFRLTLAKSPTKKAVITLPLVVNRRFEVVPTNNLYLRDGEETPLNALFGIKDYYNDIIYGEKSIVDSFLLDYDQTQLDYILARSPVAVDTAINIVKSLSQEPMPNNTEFVQQAGTAYKINIEVEITEKMRSVLADGASVFLVNNVGKPRNFILGDPCEVDDGGNNISDALHFNYKYIDDPMSFYTKEEYSYAECDSIIDQLDGSYVCIQYDEDRIVVSIEAAIGCSIVQVASTSDLQLTEEQVSENVSDTNYYIEKIDFAETIESFTAIAENANISVYGPVQVGEKWQRRIYLKCNMVNDQSLFISLPKKGVSTGNVDLGLTVDGVFKTMSVSLPASAGIRCFSLRVANIIDEGTENVSFVMGTKGAVKYFNGIHSGDLALINNFDLQGSTSTSITVNLGEITTDKTGTTPAGMPFSYAEITRSALTFTYNEDIITSTYSPTYRVTNKIAYLQSNSSANSASNTYMFAVSNILSNGAGMLSASDWASKFIIKDAYDSDIINNSGIAYTLHNFITNSYSTVIKQEGEHCSVTAGGDIEFESNTAYSQEGIILQVKCGENIITTLTLVGTRSVLSCGGTTIKSSGAITIYYKDTNPSWIDGLTIPDWMADINIEVDGTQQNLKAFLTDSDNSARWSHEVTGSDHVLHIVKDSWSNTVTYTFNFVAAEIPIVASQYQGYTKESSSYLHKYIITVDDTTVWEYIGRNPYVETTASSDRPETISVEITLKGSNAFWWDEASMSLMRRMTVTAEE